MKELQGIAIFWLVVLCSCFLLAVWVRHHEAFEWTYDGVHHTLKLGEAR